MKTAIYLRVSTSNQVIDGLSLQMQEERLSAYCTANSHTITEIIKDEGISGAKTNRPGYQKLLNLAQNREIDLIVVYSLSRFARSTKAVLDAVELFEKCSVSFVSLKESLDTTGPVGKFTLTILAALAQLERDQTSERTIDVLRHKKSKGERIGTVPYGFSLCADGINLISNSEEQEILSIIQEKRKAGKKLHQIAKYLNTKGLKNRRGNNFTLYNIHHLLKVA